jgi:DNA-binding phage protein
MPVRKIRNKTKLQKHNPGAFFQDFDKIGAALLESLVENDTEAFIEILDAYLRVNRAKVAKRSRMSRSTIQQALSKKGNPTLRTIARIVHESVA